MTFQIVRFYEDLDLKSIKIVRPSKFVFLCGGVMKSEEPSRFVSLRDFIVKTTNSLAAGGDWVLAEAANKLYQDTKYKDLISFEEDIAKIAAIILVITESPGSLAELGAFASYDPSYASLRLIVQDSHEGDKSFIREGPIRRIESLNSSFVAYFDWSVDISGSLRSDVHTHKDFILKFINDNIRRAPRKQLLSKHAWLAPFFIVLWIVFVSEVISFEMLFKVTKEIGLNLNKNELTNKLFCLELAKWIVRKKYVNRVYFYATFVNDPLDYVFIAGTSDKDSVRRKTAAGRDIALAENIPDPVRDEAIAARSGK